MNNQVIDGAVTSPAGMRRNLPERESGHHLLKRILENRRAKWEARELEQMQVQGKRLHRDEWKKKYKEPAAIEEMPSASIPESWAWASAETVCESVRDGTHDTPEYVLDGVPLVTSKNLTDGSIDFDDTKLISKEDHIEISKRSGVENGDVLFAMIGTVGNPLVVKTDREFSIKNVGLFKKNDAFLDSKFLKFWLDSPVLEKWLEPRLKGTTQKFAPLGLLRSLPIPVAPLDQQKQIVAEIEKQFSRLDEAVANLKRVKANLKRYKAAVLKAAVEGKLTEEWRKAHPDVEPASELLKGILAERRTKWQGKGKYKEPTGPGASDLPCLPKSWIWVSLEQISWDSSYGTSAKCSYENTGPAILRIPNVQGGRVDLNDLKYAGVGEPVDDADQLATGDLLIIRTNGSKNLIGRSAVVREKFNRRIGYASYLIRFRLVPEITLLGWLSTIWDCSFLRTWIEQRAATSAGQHNISMSILNTLPVPLAPVTEQERIVADVERRVSVIQVLEEEIIGNLNRTDHLRQTILAKAFGGSLVATE